MKLPLSWLKEYVDIANISPKDLADKLVNVGFEVEEIIELGKDIINVKTGKIISSQKHPNADKLRICETDMGDYKTIIVTGANNFRDGDVVPVALDDSYLPGGKHIVKSVLRGIESNGMFCSGSELGIDNSVIDGAEVNGLLILPQDTPLGIDIREILALNEIIFDISITSNRSDCQSIYGISREIATILGQKIKPLDLSYNKYPSSLSIPSISILNHDACPRYTGRMIFDVKIEESPKWMKDRLRYVGIRAINNVVDVTNYVLMEVGQPLHAFDNTLIDGGIIVRNARPNETIVALDGKNYELKEDMLVIADTKKPLAIAGVMGGEYSGINNETKTVFLETARFAKGSIRSTSRALGLRSDSSARYEKGVDFYSVETGRERALALFDKLNAGKVCDLPYNDGDSIPNQKVINTSASKISGLIGIDINIDVMVEILNNLGIETTKDGHNLTCLIPLYREDIDNYTDIAEEVIRYYGYDNITSTFIKNARPTIGGCSLRQKNVERIKDIMVAYGAYEALTYSFISKKQYDLLGYEKDNEIRRTIPILNPLSEDFSIMRTQLVGSILNSVSLNLSRKNDNFRLFEIAKTYIPYELPIKQLPKENETLSFAFVGANEDFYKCKEVVNAVLSTLNVNYTVERSKKPYLHPGISADVIANGKVIGSFGKIHPIIADNFKIEGNVFVGEICLEEYIENKTDNVKFSPLPKFPIVERDLALIVNDEVAIGELISTIKESAGKLCESVELFDVYKGSQIETGKKSVAFTIKMLSEEKTLVDSEIQEVMDSIMSAVEKKYNAELRK